MVTHADPRPQASKLTYEDYVTLPNDGRRYEILDGELVVSPAPNTLHQLVSVKLTLALGSHIFGRDLGVLLVAPCDVILDPTTTSVVEPDLIYLSIARLDMVSKRGVEGAPDLLIEILSDSTECYDRGAKQNLYATHGVARYWLIDVDAETLEIYALRDGVYERMGMHHGDECIACDVPAGLELRLGEIWPRVATAALLASKDRTS